MPGEHLSVRGPLGYAPSDVVSVELLPLKAKDRPVGRWYAIYPEVMTRPGVGDMPGVRVLGNGLPVIHETHLPRVMRMVPNLVVKNGSLPPPVEAVDFFPGSGMTLRPYQLAAVQRVQALGGRMLLADQPRMGKTATVTAATSLDDGPLVVVAPLPTRSVWTAWLGRRFPDRKIAVLRGKTFERAEFEGADCIFLHYDILRAWQSVGQQLGIGTLVFDEVHLLSNAKSTWTQSAMLLAPYAKRIIAVSGTPLWNEPAGLWSILHMLAPGAWGSRTDFALRYAGGIPNAYGGIDCTGATHTDEIRDRMAGVMLRREWRDVADQLPASTRTVEIVDVTKTERRRIDMAVEQMQQAADVKTRVGRMSQYRRLLDEIKADRAVHLAAEILRGGEPVIIWTWHRELADKLVDRLKKLHHEAFAVSGKYTQDQRDGILETWREAPAAALVITLAVGQAGIDLSHARHAIFGSLDWTPAVIGQADMRHFAVARPSTTTFLAVDHEEERNLVEKLRQKLEMAFETGIPAADTAIDMIGGIFGNAATPDMDRLLLDVLAGDDGAEDLL